MQSKMRANCIFRANYDLCLLYIVSYSLLITLSPQKSSTYNDFGVDDTSEHSSGIRT